MDALAVCGGRTASTPVAARRMHQAQAWLHRTPVHASVPGSLAAHGLMSQRPAYACQWRAHLRRTACLPRSRRSPAAPHAMVNVDFSPALVLGLGMMSGGLLLYNVRLSRPRLSRDYDVVISSISVLVGGILVFQGWRLDPLLLFGQLLTAGTATAFALEVFRLRDTIATNEERGQADEAADSNLGRWSSSQPGTRWSLPLPEEQRQYERWSSTDAQPQPQEHWADAYDAQQDVYLDERPPVSPAADVQPAYGSGYSSEDDYGGSSGSSSNAAGKQGQQSGSAYRSWGRNVDFDAVEDW